MSAGNLVRDYTCLSFSKNNQDYLFAGTTSGDVCGFLVKQRALVFQINLCSLGIRTILSVGQNRVICGGGDGQILALNVNGRNTAVDTKT